MLIRLSSRDNNILGQSPLFIQKEGKKIILPFLKEGCPIFLINTIKYSGRTAENMRLGLGKQHKKEI